MNVAPSLDPRRRFFGTWLLIASCAAFALLVLGSATLASTQRWKPYPPRVGGPWGGSVRALVSPGDPANLSDALWSTLYAATGGGVYVSADGGNTWEPRNEGLQSLDVTDLAVCWADPQRLIASTAGQGIHLSADAGVTWTRVSRSATQADKDGWGPRPQERFWSVAADPADPNHFFAATFEDSWNLLESSDGGQTWTDLGRYHVSRLRFASDRTLFFSTRDGQIYRLRPGDFVPGVVKAFPTTAQVTDLAVSGESGGVIAAAQGGEGLWITEDGGAAWTERHFSGAPNQDFHEVDVVGWDPGDPGRLLYHLNDPLGGEATALYELRVGGPRTLLPLPELGMELQGIFLTPAAEWLLESHAGVFRREGRVGAFAHSSQGLAAFSARDLAFSPARGAVAVAGGGSGSGNAGAYLWDPLAAGWLRFSPKPADSVGSTFPAVPTSLVRYRGDELWLGVPRGDGGGFFRSRDRGRTWEQRSTGLGYGAKQGLSGLEFSHVNPSLAVAGTNAGVYVSSDAGATWRAVASIPPSLGWVIARGSGSSPWFYAGGVQGSDGRFFRTGGGGASWEQPDANSFLGMQIRSLAASPELEGHLLAGTRHSGLFESFDRGDTWEPLGGEVSGLPGWGEVNAVAIGDRAADAWMAVVLDRSVYLTVDGGASWVPRDEGLTVPESGMNLISSLHFQPETARLVAAVDGRGLWYLDLYYPLAELEGVPPGPTPSRGATVRVGGEEIVAYRWSLDGSDYSGELPVAQALALAGLPEGLRRLEVVGKHADGQWQPPEASTVARWRVDATPPTGSFVIDAGAPATKSARVVLSLAAADGDGSGVTHLRVANGAAPTGVWEAYQPTRSWALPTGDGPKTVFAQFRDAAGNVSVAVNDEIVLDTIPPTGAVQIDGGAAATSGMAVTLGLSASDGAGTGVTQMRVANGASPASGAWVPYAASVSWNLAAGDGPKVVSAHFRDAAGNESAVVSASIVLDGTPPSVTAAPTAGTYTGPQTVVLTASEPATIYYTLDGSTPTTASAFGASPVTVTVSQSATLHCFAVDAVGNAAAVGSRAYVIQAEPGDTTPPVVTASPAGGTFVAPQAVVLTANEPATIYYTLDGSLPTTSPPFGPSPVTVTVSQSATLRYFGVDEAGNAGAAVGQAYVIQTLPPPDTSPPQVTVANPGGQYAGQVTVTLSVNEAAAIYYTLDGTEPTPQSTRYIGSIVIGESAVLKYIAVDTAGNASPVYTQTYTITPAAGGGGGGGGGCFLGALGK